MSYTGEAYIKKLNEEEDEKMERICRNCDHFSHHEKHPDREGFCDFHKDLFLPTGGCKHFRRIDAEDFPRKEGR